METALPVPDAMIELWQADSEGNYQHHDSTAGTRNFPWLWKIGDSGRWIVHF